MAKYKNILQNTNILQDIGGGLGIRTLGEFLTPIIGFQDQLLKPLGQPSVFEAVFIFLRKVVRIATP